VQRAREVLKQNTRFIKHTDEEWDLQFGATQFARRDASGEIVSKR
jgi:hypothetical protein